MTDDRHTPDTPFLVAEEDWRLYRDRCVADRDWVAEVDSCGRAYLLGEDFQIDSRQTLLLLLQCSRNIRKEPESDSDRGFLGFVGEEPLPVLGGQRRAVLGGLGHLDPFGLAAQPPRRGRQAPRSKSRACVSRCTRLPCVYRCTCQ